MNDNEPLVMNVLGNPPDLANARCEAFICRSYWSEGELVVTANGVHMCFDGKWYELVTDCEIIIWRDQDKKPEAYDVEENGWSYPLVDVGVEAGVIGCRLESYVMKPTPFGVRIDFRFENQRTIIIEDAGDRSNYRIE
jgi:hypothetical protein